jgi:septum site-determining protein MinC
VGSTLQIKGIREGLLVTLPEGEWEDVQAELLNEVGEKADFFKGATLILDVENHVLNAARMGKLVDLLSYHDLNLWAILSASPKTEETAQTFGLATRIHQAHPEQANRSINTDISEAGGEAMLVRRTLRSGNRIEHVGHVTVIGDVNPGAEIIASGDVVVWGKLRGTVHAGAEGDQDAVVCALELNPTQLRIADKLALAPPEEQKRWPEIARIHGDLVIAEPWEYD